MIALDYLIGYLVDAAVKGKNQRFFLQIYHCQFMHFMSQFVLYPTRNRGKKKRSIKERDMSTTGTVFYIINWSQYNWRINNL
jgi:hypothetical protein